MNSCKVVSVYSTEIDHFNRYSNCFAPCRNSLTKTERQEIAKTKCRRKSAALSCVLKPICYRSLENQFQSLPKPKNEKTFTKRSGSVDSEVLRKEINSAVTLLENRNEIDVLQPKGTDYWRQKLSKNWHYNNYERNKVPENIPQIIDPTVGNTERWKSAKKFKNKYTEHNLQDKHLTYQSLLPLKTTNFSQPTKNNGRERHSSVGSRKDGIDLISSSSNLLINSITVDEISGIKNSWMENKQMDKSSKRDYTPTVKSETEHADGAHNHKREDALRKYMDMYIHWRTVNAIEEYQLIANGKLRDRKSARIRESTPKQRLEQFRKMINERKDMMNKRPKVSSMDLNNEVTVVYDESKPDAHIERCHEAAEIKVLERESMPHVVRNDAKVNFRAQIQDDDEESKSEDYSEIDWLECVDL